MTTGMPSPEAVYELDRYTFVWPEPDGITAYVERLHEGSDGLHGELTIRSDLDPVGQLVSDRINFSSRSTKSQWVRDLEKRIPETDWHAVLDQISAKTRAQYRQGGDVIRLSDVKPNEASPWLLDKFIVDGSVSTLLFGDGGSLKSLIALASCLSVAAGVQVLPGIAPVRDPMTCLYLDWEWAPEVHAERLRALCGHLGVDVPDNILYRHEQASVVEAATGIRRHIIDNDVKFVVVDSLGFARGSEPNSAEMTIKSFNAINSFGVPTLVLDHVNKENSNNAKESTGSVYTRNSVRCSWGIQVPNRSDDDALTAKVDLQLKNRKTNGRWLKDMAWGVTLVNDERDHLATVGFQQEEIHHIAEEVGQKAGILAVLRAAEGVGMGALAIAAVVRQNIPISDATTRTILNERLLPEGKVRKGKDGNNVLWFYATDET